jgi:hypothetical protein
MTRPTAATMTRTCAVTSCVQQAIAYSRHCQKRIGFFAATLMGSLGPFAMVATRDLYHCMCSPAEHDYSVLLRHRLV